MTKVCHMTSAHAPEDVRIFHKECASLAKAGYDVYLVERGDSYEKNGVRIVGVGQPSGGRLSRMTSFSKKVYEAALSIDADIYHFHDPELLPYGLKLKRKGKRVIFDSHEHTAEAILEKTWLPAPVRNSVHWLYSRYQASVCRKLDAVVSVTPNIVRYFQAIQPRTVQVANFPYYQEAGALPDPQARRMVFAGGISAQWNHHRIIQALEQLPDCRYCLCGPIDDGYFQSLQALPAWPQVDFLGKIPHGQVANEMSRCSVGLALLTPGRNTDWQNGTMGNTKIFEEMMAGLPVVCTDFVLWREFVARYHCGICVDPENVDAIAGAIRYLLDHPKEAKQMGENGRRAVKEEFNWGVEEQKLLALYEDILKDRKGKCFI